MTSSFKEKRQSGVKRKTKFKHNATKVMKSGTSKRGFKSKTLYWDQRSGSWKPSRNKPLSDGLRKDFSKTDYKTKKNYELKKKSVNESSNKKLKIIRDARFQGTAPKFGDLRGSNTKVKSDNGKPNTEDKPTTESKVKTNELKDKTVSEKIESTTKGGPVKSGVEYAKSKGDTLAGYRRQKDTRITKKLKKAGFTEDRLAALRKKNAAFQKAKKGGKKAMEAYRKKYPKRG